MSDYNRDDLPFNVGSIPTDDTWETNPVEQVDPLAWSHQAVLTDTELDEIFKNTADRANPDPAKARRA